MIDWVKKMLSDVNGIPDEARVSAIIIIITFCFGNIYSVIMSPTHTFDTQAFGMGVGAMALGLGLWMGIRKDN